MSTTFEQRSIYSGPVRRALEGLQRKIDDGASAPTVDEKARWNSAWGQLTYIPLTSNVTGIQASPVTIFQTNVTFVSGRRYDITADLFLSKAPPDQAATCVVGIFLDVTPMAQRNLTLSAPGDAPLRVTLYNPGTTLGTHAVVVKASTQVGFLNVLGASNYPSWLSICDIGPVTPLP